MKSHLPNVWVGEQSTTISQRRAGKIPGEREFFLGGEREEVEKKEAFGECRQG